MHVACDVAGQRERVLCLLAARRPSDMIGDSGAVPAGDEFDYESFVQEEFSPQPRSNKTRSSLPPWLVIPALIILYLILRQF